VPRRSSELLTIQEVARYLNVNRFTVYRLIRQKKLPAFKVGAQWRLKQEMIDAWLAEHSTMSRNGRLGFLGWLILAIIP
jgi:excisionase family DNA binding protein